MGIAFGVIGIRNPISPACRIVSSCCGKGLIICGFSSHCSIVGFLSARNALPVQQRETIVSLSLARRIAVLVGVSAARLEAGYEPRADPYSLAAERQGRGQPAPVVDARRPQ